MHALCFLSESFRLSFNHIARYALSRNTKIFSIKIHKSSAKQFIEVPLSIEEVLPRNEKVYLHLKEDEHITQKYEIELQQELYKYIVAETIGVTKPEAKSTRSCTITDGVEGEYNRNERYKGSLEKICQDIYNHKGKEYTDNYLELYRDKNNNVLNSIL